MSDTLNTLSRCVRDLRPGVFLRRRWIENGVCAFKAPDCLSLFAAERLTPSGHSGHLSGGRTPSWRSSKGKTATLPLKKKSRDLVHSVVVSFELLFIGIISPLSARDPLVAACEREEKFWLLGDERKRGEETRS